MVLLLVLMFLRTNLAASLLWVVKSTPNLGWNFSMSRSLSKPDINSNVALINILVDEINHGL